MNHWSALTRPLKDRPGDPVVDEEPRPLRRRYAPVSNLWGLSPAQCEILRLMALGKAQTEIAEQQHVSPKTIASQLLRAREKMRVSSVGQAVLMWDRHFNRKQGA